MLLVAASTQRSEEEIEVRLAALRAIALLDENLKATSDAPLRTPRRLKNCWPPRAIPTLACIGGRLALGVIGGEQLDARLARCFPTAMPTCAYNSATWLAAQGDERACRC